MSDDTRFAAHADRVRAYIRMRLGRGLRALVDSGDVLQETFEEAIRARDRFEWRDADATAHWLCRVAENRIRGLADHAGAQKRRPVARAAPPRTGPATAAQRLERFERIEAALDALPEMERDAVLGTFFEGRTLVEIGERLGVSEAAVRRALGRAVGRLGDLLKGETGG